MGQGVDKRFAQYGESVVILDLNDGILNKAINR